MIEIIMGYEKTRYILLTGYFTPYNNSKQKDN